MIRVLKGPVYTRKRLTAAGTLITGGGIPLKKSGRYAVACATGDPEIGTDQFLGISTDASTDTASLAGSVEYVEIKQGMVLRGAAHTPANVTEALIGNSVTLDLTDGKFTINENETDDQDVHALEIVAVDIARGLVDVEVKTEAYITGGSITQA